MRLLCVGVDDWMGSKVEVSVDDKTAVRRESVCPELSFSQLHVGDSL